MSRATIAAAATLVAALVASSVAATTLAAPTMQESSKATALPLEKQLKQAAGKLDGEVAISVVHLETGKAIGHAADKRLPLFSVYKLPLAVAVLKEVEAGRLRLDQSVNVTPADVTAGVGANAERWKSLPADFTLRQLLEFSLMESDNTSADKMIALLGGPAGVTRRLHAAGIKGIEIRGGTREVLSAPEHPNRASAKAVTDLLAALHAGRLLRPAEKAVLWDFLARARTGLQRLRGLLPPGTFVVDKTGTGRAGTATNDVGIITLPDNRGHLAIAVLVIGSKRPLAEQERTIAEIAQLAFAAHAPAADNR